MILNKGNWLEKLYCTINFVNTSQTLSHFLNRNTVKAGNKNIGKFLWWKHVYLSSTGMFFLKSVTVTQIQYISNISIYNSTIFFIILLC